MFHWAELFGLRSSAQAGKKPREETATAIRLLAITADDRFYSWLVEIASGSGWEIRRASTVQEGLDLVRSFCMPLVLFDWSEDGPNWRGALGRLGAAPTHPCVLLASRVADDNLRQEVIRFRGYDVLPRSAARDQVVRTVEFAWFWTTRSYRFSDGGTPKEGCH